MIRLGDIANPQIRPESIIASEYVTEISPSLLGEFKDYLGFAHSSEDANLKRLLLSKFREIGRPTSLGLALNISVWQLRVELNGRRVVYLPRYNGVNLSTDSYDYDGDQVAADWSDVAAHEKRGDVALVRTDADELPCTTEFTWTVGFNESDYPDPVKQMVFMEVGYAREFPLGVDDRGQSTPERPTASQLIRTEWRMNIDLANDETLR